MLKRYGTATIAAALTTVLIWSTSFAGMVAALQHFSPGNLLFLRWGLTSLGFVIYGRMTGMRLPERRDLPTLILAGLLGFGVYQLLLVFGQQAVSASMAGFLVNLNPVFTTLIAVAVGRESSSRYTWIGLVACMAGLAIMGAAKGSFSGSGEGMALIAVAALSFALYTIVSKPLFARYSPMEVTTYAMVAGSLPFLVFAPGAVHSVVTATPAQIATLVFLAALPGGVAYALWSRTVSAMPPGVAARFLYLVPVVGVLVAWVWLGEAPQLLTVLGGAVTVAGVTLAGMRTAGDALPAPSVAPAALVAIEASAAGEAA
ncbi:MAG: EamA family transporter [Coriobacteriia bacterium]|nr:EamA family transporter [Coriobacteriia bacterium]